MAQWCGTIWPRRRRDWVIAYCPIAVQQGIARLDDPLDSSGRLRDMRMTFCRSWTRPAWIWCSPGHSIPMRIVPVNGHYGLSSTLTGAMILNTGRASEWWRAYVKPTLGTGPREGAVYAVAGSSAQVGGGTLDHPVNVISLNELGSMVLDVNGPRMDARFLSSTGQVRDSFTVIKGLVVAVEPGPKESSLSLLSSEPNPFALETRISFRLSASGPARLQVLDALGRRVRTLADGPRSAGFHDLTWDGRDDRGELLGTGIYFALLETSAGTWARRMVRIR